MILMIGQSNNKQQFKVRTIALIVLFVYILTISSNMSNKWRKDPTQKTPLRIGTLSIATGNCSGLVASVPYLRELMRSNDVICLSEHWLHSNCLRRLEDISNDFNVIARTSVHSDASTYGTSRGQGGGGGGVAILWRKSLGGISPMTQVTHDRICGIRAQTKAGFVLNIFSVYLPSPGSSEDFVVTLDEVAEIINTGELGTCTLLCGDFNADVGFLGGKRLSRIPTKVGRVLSNFLDEFDLVAVNMMPLTQGPLNTFNGGVGSSTIDYIMIPKCLKDMILSCKVANDEILNTSDHFVVRCTFDIECACYERPKVNLPSRIR